MDNNSFSGKRQLLHLGSIAVLVFLTFFVLHAKTGKLDGTYLWSILSHMNPSYLLFAFISMVLVVIIEGQCLAGLARPLGYNMPFGRATAYASADLYFSAITPSATGGQPASAYFMIKDGIKGSDATAILVINILMYTASLVGLGSLTVLTQWDFVMNSGWLFQAFLVLGFLLQLLLLWFCLVCMFSKKLINKLRNLLAKIINKMKFIRRKEARIRRLDQHISQYRMGMTYMKKKSGTLLYVLCGNFLQRIAFFTIAYFIYRSLGFNEFGFWEIITVQCLLYMVTCSLPIPGAVGVSEGGFMLLFQDIYPKAILAPAMLFTRIMNYYLCMVLCGIHTIIYHISVLRRRNN